MAPSTASVIGALRPERAGIGSATNSTALQIGGALGVAVMGSVLAAHYQGRMTQTLAGHPLPAAAQSATLGSVGGALAVAQAAGGALAFDQGMDLAPAVGVVSVGIGAVLVLAALPSRPAVDGAPPEAPAHRDPTRGPLTLSTEPRPGENGTVEPTEAEQTRSAPMTNIPGANASPGPSGHRIVVGVDGSVVGDRALDWAAVQAVQTGAVLEIHTAWDKEHAFVTAEEVQEAMAQLLARSSERAARVAPGVTTVSVAHEGHAAPALIEASPGADLLVVGTRGLGGFRGLVLGSVSLQCVHHAQCPVTVVP